MAKTEAFGVSLRTVSWGRLFAVALAGTILQVIANWILGGNPFSFGAVLVRHATQTAQNLAGAAGALVIGQVYGLLYAVLFAPVKLWGRLLRALIASLFIDFLSILTMPGAAAVTWANAWPRGLEFLVFTLTLSFLYRNKQTDGIVEGSLP